MKNLEFKNVLSRRNFAKACGLAASTAVLPAGAQSALPEIRRVVFVFIPGGAPEEYWLPPAGVGNCAIGALPEMSAPLNPVAQHCTFFSNLDVQGGHGTPFRALGGDFPAESMTGDVVVGRYLQDFSPHANLHLGVQTLSDTTSLSKDETGFLPYILDPAQGFNYLFGNDDLPMGAQEYFQSADESFDKISDLQIDLAALALKEDKTRAVTLMLGGDQADFIVPEIGMNFSYHSAMSSGNTADYITYRSYLTGKLTRLIKTLELTPDAHGQSLLDSTLVVHVSGMADGRSHSGVGAPFLLAGGRNFFSQPGRVNALGNGAPEFMDTVATILGVPSPSFGSGVISGVV